MGALLKNLWAFLVLKANVFLPQVVKLNGNANRAISAVD